MNQAERRMVRTILRPGGGKRFTVLGSAETGLPTFGRLKQSDAINPPDTSTSEEEPAT